MHGPPHPLSANWTLEDTLARMLTAHPARRDKPALLTDEGSISFQELDTRTHQLARGVRTRLRAAPSSAPQATPLVGVCMSRGPAMVEVLFAVLRAGGAYLPIDPTYPPARLAHIAAEAAPSLIVAGPEHESLVRQLAPPCPYWVFDPRVPLDLEGEEDPGRPESTSPPAGERPFAVLYTSGSTGRPRGVCLPHRAAQNRFQWMWRTFPFAEGEVCCFKTSLGFVDSIWELFGALLQGVPVAIAPDGLEKQPERLLAFAARHGVSRLIVVPSLLRLLLPHLSLPPAGTGVPVPKLHLWTCSGEPLPSPLAEAFLARRPGDVLLNLYGSTEVMGDVTAHVCRAGEDPVPIGRPIDNTTLELLDETGAPVKVGERGILHVRGANLSLGHLGPGRVSAWTEEGGRYDTGDLGRMVRDPSDGGWMLLHEGRRDRQVKLLGNRFELAELERVLLRCEGVLAAVALVREDAEGPSLLGFVQPREPGAVTLEALHAACEAELPPHARPALSLVEHLPLLPNGKLDRQRLLALGGTTAALGEDPFSAAWHAVLPRAPIEEDTDFFEAGGTSLLAVDLLRRLREAGKPVSLEQFYAAPSLAALRRGARLEVPHGALTVRPLEVARDALGTAAVNLLADRFDEIDPLKQALGATRADLHALYASYLDACVLEGLSFVAVDGRGELVGCVVAADLSQVHTHAREGRFVVAPRLEALDAIMSAITDPWCHQPSEPGPGEWVYVLLLAATGQREVARVARELETTVIGAARARGYRGVVTVNSHALTQHLCEELGYRTEASLDVREFVHADACPFAQVPEDGAELRLQVLRCP